MILAPVVKERRGEYQQLFEKLKAQGYLRVRINGEVLELSDVPSLNLRQKHKIDVVIDRIKVRPEIKQRLAESFEHALRLGDGVALVAPLTTGGFKEQTFSAKFTLQTRSSKMML